MLTEQQSQIMIFIRKFIAEEGYPPTLKEIGDEHSLSITQARKELISLEGLGYIKRKPAGSRAIRILRQSIEERAAA